MRPLILDFAVKRHEDNSDFRFHYSTQRSLNVAVVENTEIPVIDLDASTYAQYTETRQAREQTDQAPFLRTETKAARDVSDKDSIMLELQTKTFTARETDDERSNYY